MLWVSSWVWFETAWLLHIFRGHFSRFDGAIKHVFYMLLSCVWVYTLISGLFCCRNMSFFECLVLLSYLQIWVWHNGFFGQRLFCIFFRFFSACSNSRSCIVCIWEHKPRSNRCLLWQAAIIHQVSEIEVTLHAGATANMGTFFDSTSHNHNSHLQVPEYLVSSMHRHHNTALIDGKLQELFCWPRVHGTFFLNSNKSSCDSEHNGWSSCAHTVSVACP